MRFQKNDCKNAMKFVMFAFLTYLTVNTFYLDYEVNTDKEETMEYDDIKDISEFSPSSSILNYLHVEKDSSPTPDCGKSWSIYAFAFVLGAFWNVKKIRMLGVV